MDDLDTLHDCLMDAWQLVNENMPAKARMKLLCARALLRPIKDEYSDVRILYINLGTLFNGLRKHRLLCKDWALDGIEAAIDEVEDFRDCKRRAA